MSIMDRLGWSKDVQTQITNVVRNTRDSYKHTIVGMRGRRDDGTLFIRVYDRTGTTCRVVADSKPMRTREKMIETYDKLIRQLGLPYCCIVHKEECEGPGPSFFDDIEDEVEEFSFGDDEDEFDFGTTDEEEFDFDMDDEDEFDLGLDEDEEDDDLDFDLDEDEEDEEFEFE